MDCQIVHSLLFGEFISSTRHEGGAMASTTRLVKTTKVAWSGMSSVLTRLMMFVNDTGIVNESLRDWSTTQDKERKARKNGARTFFSRLQMALVFEALEAIAEIRASKDWIAKVEKCDARAQERFAKVCAYIDSKEDYKVLAKLRNNAAFHYGNKLSVKAVEELAVKNPEETATGDDG
jgi:hypothetical protein